MCISLKARRAVRTGERSAHSASIISPVTFRRLCCQRHLGCLHVPPKSLDLCAAEGEIITVDLNKHVLNMLERALC